MHSSSGFFKALLLLSTATAAPLNEIHERAAKFTVHQSLNPGFKEFYSTGQAALAKAYAKYGATMPVDVASAVAAVAAASSGTVTATPEEYDSEYLCPVSIGTPAQVLNLDFDTGSADLWVFSSETPKASVNGQKLYTPASSTTSKLVSGATWSITYGDESSSSGDVYDDVVSVGGVSYASQAVESAKKVSAEFTSDSDSSGLLGLAFSTINTVKPTKQKTFFDNVKSSLASPLFTVDLKYHAAGTYDFGFIDSAKYTGSISYATTTTSNGFWEITGSGYAVGTGSFVTSSIDAIADTGTTLLLIPQTIVAAYYAKVTGAKYSSTYGGYVFPCTATLPSFTFGVGTYRGTIPGTYINYAPATSTTCYGGIQSDEGIGFSIFGDILLKAQFVVFDGSTNRVGFAAKTL